jgi:hypothetical protein
MQTVFLSILPLLLVVVLRNLDSFTGTHKYPGNFVKRV